MIAWESQLERDAIFLFEFSQGVLRYIEQPERVYFPQKGTPGVYIPDFQLECANGEMLQIEIKPFKKLEKPETAERFKAITEHYQRCGRRFQILTELEIRREPLISNLRCLNYHTRRMHEADIQRSVDKLRLNRVNTISAAIGVLGHIKDVYRILASGQYYCDIESDIVNETAITPSSERSNHATLLF
jgi:hypothetical protein